MARRTNSLTQGMYVPEAGTFGTSPTMWKDPTPTATSPMSFQPADAGTRRNYGSTPAPYLDTMPHRWTVGEQTFKGAQVGAYFRSRAQDRTSAEELGITPDEVRSRRRTARATEIGGRALERDRRIAMGLPPATEALGGEPPTEGPAFGPPTGRGRVTPRPPAEAEDVSGSTPSLDTTPFPPRRAEEAPWDIRPPSGAGVDDPFMEAVRRAPAEPMPEEEGRWREPSDYSVARDSRLGYPTATTADTSPEAQAEAIDTFWGGVGTGPYTPPKPTRPRSRRST